MADETTLVEQASSTQEAPKPDVAELIAGFEQRVTDRLDDMTSEIRAMKQEVIQPLAAAEADLAATAAVADAPPVESEGILSTVAHKAAELEHSAVNAVRSLVQSDGDPDAVGPPSELRLPPVPPLASEPLPGPHVRAVEQERAQTAAGVVVAA